MSENYKFESRIAVKVRHERSRRMFKLEAIVRSSLRQERTSLNQGIERSPTGLE